MDLEKKLAWFLTKKGRIFTRFTVGVVSASIVAIRLSLNGPFLPKYQEIIQVHSHGKPKPLPKQLEDRSNEVLRDCGLDKKESNITFFNVLGHDVYHAGTRRSPWGAIIGLPFNYEKNQQVEFSKMRFGSIDTIDWLIEGSDFIDTLDISEEAQKFAIAKEVFATDTTEILENSCIEAFCLFVPAELARKANRQYNMFKYPFRNRMMLYTLLYVTGYVLYKCLKDPLKHLYDAKNDKKAAQLSPAYLRGGIEYYEKALLGNQELRVLLEARGESMFTKQGNHNFWFLTPKLPLTKHLEKLKDLEKELSSPSSSAST